MWKVAIIFALLLMITLISGHSCTAVAQTAVMAADIKGEWKVISTNCLDVIAEKGGLRRIFVFKPPTGYDPGVAGEMGILAKCKEVKPGWIIFVESEEKYTFFPPPAPPAKSNRISPPKSMKIIN